MGKGEIAHYKQFLLFPQCFQKLVSQGCQKVSLCGNGLKFDENGRKFSKQAENTVERGEIAHYEQFLLFPQCFQKTCTADT